MPCSGIPAMTEAAATGKKILFLTAGIPLQEQLIHKDLPALNRVLGLSFPFGLLKGKGNYACLVRAAEASESGRGGFLSFGDGGAASMLIAQWLETTETGISRNCACLLILLRWLEWRPHRGPVSASAALQGQVLFRKALREAQDWSVVWQTITFFLLSAWGGKALSRPLRHSDLRRGPQDPRGR